MSVWGQDPAVLRCDHHPSDPQTDGPRSVDEVLAWSRGLLDPALRDAVETLPRTMRDIAAFHFGWRDICGRPTSGTSGKAIRPALTLLAARAVGGAAETALPAAVAVELAHNFSLLHDDVMDGDLTRRHRPTAWTVYGTSAAVLAGDALLAAAFEALVHAPLHPTDGSAALARAVRTLGHAVTDLVEGQNVDLAFEERDDVTLDECVAMASGKTGALIGAACALGASHGGGTAVQTARLHAFGERLGLAFQLVDDLLGIWGDPAVTGKAVHADLYSRKKSLPVVAALTSATPAATELAALYLRDDPLTADDASRAAALIEAAGARTWATGHAATLVTDALAELDAADLTPTPTTELRTLAHHMTHRDH
ncbi:geranylgeranyl diphosphate synthase type I [Actinomadura pelletieri DSM 43383]|uniref:Geranylgeranyl diphosphate synthase type I n=1 Tax=Actinomadura pelletieri DSM 43383 TaxID=1120940 RepID=A0A495QTN7_9ACTN|nr:family 2 encapsulin nanocompartment cargo protein polyprenyl transferase [Actinomadura pelletieri]RKS76880.1 geranylgeranyl diphosphate synthase type I [Actinomadura pelletieri DSM 43383]